MNDNFEQFITALEKLPNTIYITEEEKKMTREKVIAYANRPFNLTPGTRLKPTVYSRTRLTNFWQSWSLMFRTAVIAGGVFIILLAGIGTSWAAENSLPGDLLYPIKIYLNEPARGLIKRAPAATASWQIERSQRRLREMESLALRGKLNSAATVAAVNRLKQYSRAIEENVETLDANDDNLTALEVVDNFEATLSAHENVISHLAKSDAPAARTVKDITAQIKNSLSNIKNLQQQSESNLERKPTGVSATAAEAKLRDARNELGALKQRDTRQAGAASLAKTEELINEGEEALRSQNYARALSRFRQAQTVASRENVIAERTRSLRAMEPASRDDIFSNNESDAEEPAVAKETNEDEPELKTMTEFSSSTATPRSIRETKGRLARPAPNTENLDSEPSEEEQPAEEEGSSADEEPAEEEADDDDANSDSTIFTPAPLSPNPAENFTRTK